MKQSRKDYVGISALTVQSNTLCTDQKKAFNKYFQLAFTQSMPVDVEVLPVVQSSMKNVDIDIIGVDCMLWQVDTVYDSSWTGQPILTCS